LTLPVPIRKVDPKYFPAAIADRMEGNVRLAAVVRKDGRVDSVDSCGTWTTVWTRAPRRRWPNGSSSPRCAMANPWMWTR
jgi:hypothetical protein